VSKNKKKMNRKQSQKLAQDKTRATGPPASSLVYPPFIPPLLASPRFLRFGFPAVWLPARPLKNTKTYPVIMKKKSERKEITRRKVK
jgi:hypothetical protein